MSHALVAATLQALAKRLESDAPDDVQAYLSGTDLAAVVRAATVTKDDSAPAAAATGSESGDEDEDGSVPVASVSLAPANKSYAASLAPEQELPPSVSVVQPQATGRTSPKPRTWHEMTRPSQGHSPRDGKGASPQPPPAAGRASAGALAEALVEDVLHDLGALALAEARSAVDDDFLFELPDGVQVFTAPLPRDVRNIGDYSCSDVSSDEESDEEDEGEEDEGEEDEGEEEKDDADEDEDDDDDDDDDDDEKSDDADESESEELSFVDAPSSPRGNVTQESVALSEDGEEDGYSSGTETEASFVDEFPFESDILTLTRHFQFLDRLSTHDDAVVWEAYDRRTKEHVAIKLATPLPDDGKVPREIRIMALLQGHPNVQKVLSWYAFQETESYALVSPFYKDDEDWEPLEDPVGLREHMRQIIETMVFIQSHGVFYRDVKPSNILRERATGRTIIIDYDCATFCQPKLKHRGYVGSEGFMAPEVALHKEADEDEDEDEDDNAKPASGSEATVVVNMTPGANKPRKNASDDEDEADDENEIEEEEEETPPPPPYDWRADTFSIGIYLGQILFEKTDEADMIEWEGESVADDFRNWVEEMPREDVSPGHDLMMRMIAADPDKRIALQDCLKHPFLLDDQGR